MSQKTVKTFFTSSQGTAIEALSRNRPQKQDRNNGSRGDLRMSEGRQGILPRRVRGTVVLVGMFTLWL
jgi:hypothetical protein